MVSLRSARRLTMVDTFLLLVIFLDLKGPEYHVDQSVLGTCSRFDFMVFNAAASAPTYSFPEFFLAVLLIKFFLSHWPLSNITLAETMDCGEREINHVAMIIITSRTEYWPRIDPGSSCSKSCSLPTELLGSSIL